MAQRAGSFGRRPRKSSGNLSSTISALRKQQQATEWQAIQDAWKNGGLYDGKPVTDEDVLRYMAKRRDQLTKDDPEYALWDNAVTQSKFNIEEAQIGLAFKQGTMTARQVAEWYKGQLANYPQDSDFYRTIAAKAADWAKSAADAGRGNAANAVTKALTDRKNRNDQVETAFYGMANVVMAEAVSRGFAVQGTGGMLTITDPAGFDAMLGQGVTGPDGTTYHRSDWDAGVKATYIAQGDTVAVYHQGGNQYANDEQTARNAQAKFTQDYLMPTNSLGFEERASVIHDQLDKAMESAQNNPAAQQAAVNTAVNQYNDLLADGRRRGNDPLNGGVSPEFLGAVQNDITTLTTGIAPGVGSFDAIHGGSEDTTSTETSIKKLRADQELMSSGAGVYMQSAPGTKPEVVDVRTIPGVTIGPDGSYVENLPDSLQVTKTTVGGQTVDLWLNGRPEYQTVVWDAQDKKILNGGELGLLTPEQLATPRYQPIKNPAVATLIGYTYYDVNGKPIKYGVIDAATGKQSYTDANPFKAELGSDGYHVIGGIGTGHETATGVTVDGGLETQGSAVAPLRPWGQEGQGGPGFPLPAGSIPSSTDFNQPAPYTPGERAYMDMYGGAPATRPDVALQPGQTYTNPNAPAAPTYAAGTPGEAQPGTWAQPGNVGPTGFRLKPQWSSPAWENAPPSTITARGMATTGSTLPGNEPGTYGLISVPAMPALEHDSRLPMEPPKIKLPSMPELPTLPGYSGGAPQPGQTWVPPLPPYSGGPGGETPNPRNRIPSPRSTTRPV